MQLARSLWLVVTAGGTKEPIDPVRYIGNVSTGALGRELALAGARRGHQTLLLSPDAGGPLPMGVVHRPFTTTADLERELKRASTERKWDVVLHAAAVADYRPAEVSPSKIGSDQDELVLRLVRTPKLIASLRDWFATAFLVGFKLSTNLPPEERKRLALEQMAKNRTDLCIENDLTDLGPGQHQARLIAPDGVETAIPKADKAAVATRIIEHLDRVLATSARLG